MKKNQYFKLAIKERLYEKKKWVFSAFAVVTKAKDGDYPYKIVQTPTAIFFQNPDNSMQLEKLDDCVPGEPPFTWVKDKISLVPGDLENVTTPINTTIGNFFFNASVIAHSFGKKMNFITGRASMASINAEIASRLTDDDKANENDITVSEYLAFVDALFVLTAYSQLVVWGATEKIILPPPGIVEFKKKLLEENKDRLTDSAVIANIDKQLVDYAAKYIGDDPGSNFLIKDKLRKIVQKKLYAMHGAEADMSEGVKVNLVKNSLSEGWTVEDFPVLNNSLRTGSFSRGAQTQDGGEAVKWLLRASVNTGVTKQDCGTILGITRTIDKNNVKELAGSSIVEDSRTIDISTEEEAGKYLGKTITVRSPMYCLLGRTDFCEKCVGAQLAKNPTSLSMAITRLGSVMMLTMMSAAHAKELATQRMNFKEVLK